MIRGMSHWVRLVDYVPCFSVSEMITERDSIGMLGGIFLSTAFFNLWFSYQ